MLTPVGQYRLRYAIGFHSAAIIAFQLALIQILSITQWHHFAYMVISMAMLGFGAAGTVVALTREKLLKGSDELMPILMMATAITMAWVTEISQASYLRFDSYLLFNGYSQVGKLLLTYLL